MKQESTMTPVHSQLLETLEELGSGDLEKFKHVLLYTKMKEGLPKIPKDQVETADKDEIVKLMVEIYGCKAVQVTLDLLRQLNLNEEAEELANTAGHWSWYWQGVCFNACIIGESHTGNC
uniref:Pyrin domain-containing protein n=1 Tax=Labrus bergylta TaxID=56723 RepID=A0A3Q3FQE5_9LABR